MEKIGSICTLNRGGLSLKKDPFVTGKTQQNNQKYATAVLLRTWQRFYDNTTFINTQQRPWSWFRMSPFMSVFNMSTFCDRDKDSTPIRTSWNFREYITNTDAAMTRIPQQGAMHVFIINT